MRMTRTIPLLGVALLCAPTVPVAAQAVLAFEVAVEFQPPPDDGRPVATLELQAELSPPPDDGSPPPDDSLIIEFFPPDPTFPPDPVEPVWQISVPAGCFEASRTKDYRVRDPAGCGAGIAQVFPDGTRQDLSRFLTAFEARLGPPPDDGLPWILRLELATESLPAENLPPDPVLGSIRIQSGDASGEAFNRVVAWSGATSPSAEDTPR